MVRTWAICALGLTLGAAASGQQPPPIGIAPIELTAAPYRFDTAEVHGIEVSVVARGFGRPFAIDFLPGGDMLLAIRGGGLHVIRAATDPGAALDPQPIAGIDAPGTTRGSFGLHDIAVHPDFARNGLLYWTWNEPVPNAEKAGEPPEQGRLRLMRGRLADGRLSDISTLFEGGASYPGGTRIAIDGTGMVWLTTPAPFDEAAQDLASPYGKVLRVTGEGGVPPDNPFIGRAGANPAIYSYGHRDQHGLVVHSESGRVFSAEHGPNGGDELNLIAAGANYGWPEYTFGRNYDGTPMTARAQGEGVTDPLVVWLPSIAPSGLMFYTGEAFPAWKGNLFIGSGRRGGIDFTGGLERVVFNPEFGELRRETLLAPLHQRVRDVVQGPDGLIYVLTDGNENAVLRIAPAGRRAPGD